MQNKISNIRAFTLAEVLITLVVIGVVAAISVPTLFANYQKTSTVSKLKKSYSSLASAIRLSELNNGPISTWNFSGEAVNGIETEFFDTYIKPYLNVSTKYGYNSSERIDYPILNIDGTTAININSWYRLADGTAITARYGGDSSNSSIEMWSYYWIFIDVNNSGKPNRLGRDIFMFDIYRKNRFEFWGNEYDNYGDLKVGHYEYNCEKGSGKRYAGAFCGAIIQRNTWEIPNGYPW